MTERKDPSDFTIQVAIGWGDYMEEESRLRNELEKQPKDNGCPHWDCTIC